MVQKISAVINTFNEEANIKRAIESVKWADEIIVCDMHSSDQTVKVAKKFGAKIAYHKKEEYVELARNFAISKAISDWILVVDPDEEVPQSLAVRLVEISRKMKRIDYVRLPRKNTIFGKWMKASMWWPDYNIRFFRKGKVAWTNKIHRPPEARGAGLDLPEDEKWAIVHHHYESVSQFLQRMDRYTKIQSMELKKEGYKFSWQDLISKPLREFLSRFFANRGYEDGLHGLALSLLQAFSFLAVYLKVWEMDKFKEQELKLEELELIKKQAGEELNYWFNKSEARGNLFKTFFKKFKT